MNREAEAVEGPGALEVVRLAAQAAEAKLAQETVVLDVRLQTSITDYFLITSGERPVQIRAIAGAIEERLSGAGLAPQSIEGKQDGGWVLLDYGDVIIHVMRTRERSFYKLEQFWSRALIVNWQEWEQ